MYEQCLCLSDGAQLRISLTLDPSKRQEGWRGGQLTSNNWVRLLNVPVTRKRTARREVVQGFGIRQPWSHPTHHHCDAPSTPSCQPHSISTHLPRDSCGVSHVYICLWVAIVCLAVGDTPMASKFNSLCLQTSILDLYTVPGKFLPSLWPPYTLVTPIFLFLTPAFFLDPNITF